MIFGLFGGVGKRNRQLRGAASEGQVDAVKTLLAEGADVSQLDPKSGETALNLAVNGLHVEAASMLLSHGANVNLPSKAGTTALYIAASHGDKGLDIAQRLLTAGAQVDLAPKARGSEGFTPLYVAAFNGAERMFDRLLSAGASPLARSMDGTTVMHAAAMGGSAGIIKRLHELGVSLDTPRGDGIVPLHVAAVADSVTSAETLLDLGAALEATEDQGGTPLMTAALHNSPGVVKLLLQRGAKADRVVATDGTEMNALCGAAIKGYDEVVQALTDAGAQVDIKLRGLAGIIELTQAAGHGSTVKILKAERKRQRAVQRAAKGSTGSGAGRLTP